MDEKLVNIINEMAEYLNIAQMKKLQEVLLKHLINSDVEKRVFLIWNICKCL